MRSPDEISEMIEGEGDNIEAVSFESVIKAIEDDDSEAQELMEEIPTIVTLLKAVHKHGFWRGVLFGKHIVSRLIDEDSEYYDTK